MKIFVRVVLIVAAVIIAVLLAFYIYMRTLTHPDHAKTEAILQITAAQLYKGFVDNEIASAKQYNGKVINIEGVVDTIELIDNRRIAVMFVDEGIFGFEGVRILLDSTETRTIDVGSSVIIKGYCTGFSGNDVIVEYGIIVSTNAQ